MHVEGTNLLISVLSPSLLLSLSLNYPHTYINTHTQFSYYFLPKTKQEKRNLKKIVVDLAQALKDVKY